MGASDLQEGELEGAGLGVQATEFLLPLRLAVRPLTLVIAQFSGQMNAELHLLMAAVALCLTPMFLLYVFGQRFFVEGITMTGLKG